MPVVSVICWEDDGWWLGYLQDHPDYWTQGETLEDLQDNLRGLYRDLAEE